MRRQLLLAGNWKMNKTVAQTLDFISTLEARLGEGDPPVLLFPPFTALYSARQRIRSIHLGAQNMYHEPGGAYTGEISPAMLREICEYVLVGHSERRHVFGEGNNDINRKILRALEYDLIPVLCVGETKAQRDGEQTFDVLHNQLETALEGVEKPQVLRLTLAYEPVWAIGTGDTATPKQAQQAHRFIRRFLTQRGIDAGKIRILYGGSVKPANCVDLLSRPDIDGALIGGASLQVDSFFDIIQKSKTVKKSGG